MKNTYKNIGIILSIMLLFHTFNYCLITGSLSKDNVEWDLIDHVEGQEEDDHEFHDYTFFNGECFTLVKENEANHYVSCTEPIH